ncbi:hypothetical protein H4R19_000757 [Coemansia spiralis]|nr:hypothetical protein H4R19_000757 [Coemansia spiralis]
MIFPGIDASRYGFVTNGNGDHTYLAGRFMSVTVHPNFNPVTFSNNIALLRFPQIDAAGYSTFAVGAFPTLWPTKLSVHRTLNKDHAWNSLHYLNGPMADDTTCQAGSGLYASNLHDFLCTESTMDSEYKQGCRMPYQYFITVNNDKAVQAALYSHSSTLDDNALCTTAPVYNYYLNVASYVPWISQAIGAQVDFVVPPNSPSPPVNVAYKMTEPTVASSANRKIFSLFHWGEFLGLKAPPPPPPPVETTPPLIIAIPKETAQMVVGLPAAPMRSMIFVETKTATSTVIDTKEASTVTTSTTTTQTKTSTSSSTATTTATLSHTDTSTTTLSTTFTTTVTQTSVTVAANVAIVSTTTDATTSSTTTLTLTSNAAGLPVCPIVTPCPPAGPGAGSTTVTHTSTTTSTLTLASYNFAISGQVQTAPGAPGPILATVTFTTTQKAGTATSTVTVPAASHPATTTTTTVRELVSSTTTLPAKTSTHHLMSTIVSTSVRVESAPEKPTPPAQPWAIAMTIIIALLVVAVVSVLLFSCCWKRKRYQPDNFTQYNSPPSANPPDYYTQVSEKRPDDGYYTYNSYVHEAPGARPSWYNPQGL